jgi:hypothetical protein
METSGIMDVKKCTCCGELKSYGEFGKARAKDRLQCICKAYKSIKDKAKVTTSKQKYYLDNKDKISLKYKQKYKKNKEKVKAKTIEYAKQNRDKVNAYFRKYNKEQRRIGNFQYILSKYFRSRINHIMKGKVKTGSALKELGCSLKYLQTYLESKFQIGVTWKNYGEWYIDHIMPLASFNLQDPEDFRQACHYTNLQPFWATDNLKKGAKLL